MIQVRPSQYGKRKTTHRAVAARGCAQPERLAAAAVLLMLVAPAYPAEKLNVKIIDRRDSGTRYTYVAPGYSNANSDTTVNCFGTASSVNCSGSTRTTASEVPARTVSYEVRGATLSLQLPDGRIAVVNCESKYAPKFDYVNRRSCRLPIVDDIQAEFTGNKAKLVWIVSVDGKKTESETYKILAVLGAVPAPRQTAEGQDTIATPSSQVGGHVGDTQPPMDVMTWFDEPAPGPATEIRDVFITVRGYDGVVNILSKLRDSDTAVMSGVSVLEVGYL